MAGPWACYIVKKKHDKNEKKDQDFGIFGRQYCRLKNVPFVNFHEKIKNFAQNYPFLKAFER